jgi:hypothetical protein
MTNILVVKVTPQPLTMRMTIPEKPREERSYLDFIPDLKSSKPIEIRWFPEIQSEDEAVLPQIKEGADSILSSLSWMVGGMFKKINQLRQDSSLKSQSVSQKIEVVNSNPIQPILSGPVLFLKSSSEKIPKGSFEKLCGLALPDFMLPNRHFLRYSDPFEEELYNRVEYDMDEQGMRKSGLIFQSTSLKHR